MSGKRPRIPSDWGGMVVGCGDGKKKKHADGGGESTGDDALAPASIESAFENIIKSIDRAHQDTTACRDINLDNILSRVPYKEMLQDLFGSSDIKTPSIPIVTKAYEESFMRPPVHPSERGCVQGSDCECNIIGKGEGFIGVEFCIPGTTQTAGRGKLLSFYPQGEASAWSGSDDPFSTPQGCASYATGRWCSHSFTT